MRAIRTSGLMSGERNRATASRPRTAPFLDSTQRLAATRDRRAFTALRSTAVLEISFRYACGRQSCSTRTTAPFACALGAPCNCSPLTRFASTVGRVEERRGARPTGSRPIPLPAHQTVRADFPHQAFRQDSSPSLRRSANVDMTKPQNAQLVKDHRIRESAGAFAISPHGASSGSPARVDRHGCQPPDRPAGESRS